MTLVVLSLLVLLLIPVLTEVTDRGWRTASVRAAEPAAEQIHSLKAALLSEITSAQLYLATGDPSSLNRLRVARAAQDRALAALAPHVRALGPHAADGLRQLQAKVAQSHAASDTLLDRDGLTRGGVPARIDSVEAVYQQVVRSADDLYHVIAQAEAGLQRTAGVGEQVKRRWIGLLAFIALMAALLVGRLDRELRLFARQSERERREKSMLLESTSEGIYGIDTDGRCTFINQSGAEMLGYSPEELIGQPIHQLIHGPEAGGTIHSEYDCPVFRTIRTGERLRIDGEVFRRKDGSQLPVEYGASPMVEEGEVRGVVVNFLDASDRKEGEHQRALLLSREQSARASAERAEKRARLLADAAELFAHSLDYETTLRSLAHLVVPRIADSCIIYLVDRDGRVQRLEPTHVDPEMQATLRQKLREHPPRLESLIPPVRNALILGEATVTSRISADSLKGVPGDEDHVSVLNSVSLKSLVVAPLRARERVLGAISYGSSDPGFTFGSEDVEFAKELAQRAALAIDNARLYEASQAAVRAREETLGIVSHDLRSPLNVVRMGTQALLRHWPPTGNGSIERKQLEVIGSSAERMYHLIQDLLDMAQIDAGRLAIEPRPTHAVRLTEEVLDLLRPLAEEKSISLEHEISSDIPLLMVDGERMHQVLSNLINNAIRFTPSAGSIAVRAFPVGESHACFAVTDTGCGIADEDLPSLFDRFWQGQRKRGGAGLGLGIAKGIVESHGGRMWVESREGVGSTFFFTIPAVTASAGPTAGSKAIIPAGELDGTLAFSTSADQFANSRAAGA